MNTFPQISEAEYKVMEIVWSHAPISTNEVVDLLLPITTWKPKTIQTLLKRLTQKEAITYERIGHSFVYTPLITKEAYIHQKSHSFLNRYFNGNLGDMLSSYLSDPDVSEAELARLRTLLDEKSVQNR